MPAADPHRLGILLGLTGDDERGLGGQALDERGLGRPDGQGLHERGRG